MCSSIISTPIDERRRHGGARGLLPGVRDAGLLLTEALEAGGASPSRVAGLSLARRAAAEAIGTALLVAAVIGSGVSASRLSPNDVGLQLFENAMATGAALVAIILAFGPVSGAYLNPVVTGLAAARGRLATREAWAYGGAQIAGGVVGAVIANLMFSL